MSDIIIAIISAIIGALFGIIGTVFTLRFNYRQLYAETVSTNRNLWRNELREFIAKMVAEVSLNKGATKTKEYFVYRNQILMRLNVSEPYHKMIEHLIYDFDKINSQSDFEKNFIDLQDKIIEVSCNVMKLEWETVKKEVKGG